MPVDMRACARDVGNGVGTTYDTEFEVYADGYHFKLVDPYSVPKLYIRRPGMAELESYTFSDVSASLWHVRVRLGLMTHRLVCVSYRTTRSILSLRRSSTWWRGDALAGIS